MTTKADRKSEDAQKDDSGREGIGTEIKEREMTQKLSDE